MPNKRISQMPLISTINDSDELTVLRESDPNNIANKKATYAALKAPLAVLRLPNVFEDVQTIPGLRIGTDVIVDDYNVQVTDFELSADASAHGFSFFLPMALGTGQMLRIKKIDLSPNLVRIIPKPGDLIDHDTSETLSGRDQGITLIDSALGQWDNATFISAFVLPPNVALRDQDNIFTALNIFTGIRLKPVTITGDFTFDPLVFEYLMDCSAGPIIGTLPPSTGEGQYWRIKKIDTTANVGTIAAVGSDLIDGSISVNLTDQWADAQLVDAAPGYWDNTGTAASGGVGADFGLNGRVVDLNPIRGFAFEVFNGTIWVEQVRYTEPSSSPPPSTDVSYFWRPEIINLTLLKAWPTLGNLVNSRMDCMYGAGSNISNSFSVYLLKRGAASGGDPGQVAPDDYNASTNDVHWLQIQ